MGGAVPPQRPTSAQKHVEKVHAEFLNRNVFAVLGFVFNVKINIIRIFFGSIKI